jgi:tetratricopeptide (TPR) repeat protein
LEWILKVSNVFRTSRSFIRPFARLAITLLLAGFFIKSANAGIIDHIEILQKGDEAEIRILFTNRIEYLRQNSLKNGDIRIYFNYLGPNVPDRLLTPEVKESPPSDIVPHFTVYYPELDSSLSISFSRVVDYQVRAGKDGRSISIFTPVIKPKSESESKAATAAAIVAAKPAIAPPVIAPSVTLPVAPAMATLQQTEPVTSPQPESAAVVPLAPARPAAEIEQEAQQLIGSARYALQNDRSEAAISTLNKLLNLPPNQQSQSAQRLIGEAWQKSGEFDKARVEYELYLKLYPEAADRDQVKALLAGLPAKATAKPVPVVAAKPKLVEEPIQVFGGLTQYYYHGVSHTDSLIIGGTSPTTTSFTLVDQSQLLTMLDLTGRKRTETADTRVAFRDIFNFNFLSGQRTDNRLDIAYLEQNSRNHTYMYRLGRQSGTGGGAPGRFDGVLAGYNLTPAWRVNGVIGSPVEFTRGGTSTGSSKDFAGVSVDLAPVGAQWSGNGYFIQQRIGGLVDRRAVGAETHYFDMQRNIMGLFEYDTLFRKINLGMIQGNWTAEGKTTYNLLVDHRRTPILQYSNALIGQPIPSVPALIQSGVSMDTIRADALALSPISNTIAFGMTRPYSPSVLIGGDFRVSNLAGTGATSTGLPATAGIGNTYSFSIQATGNNLFLENDYGVVNATYTSSKTYKGESVAFTQVETFRQNWRVDMMLMLYNQNDVFGTNQKQIRPSLRLNYRLNNSVNLEGEGGIEQINTKSAIQDDKTRRRYFYVGYRWDFQ